MGYAETVQSAVNHLITFKGNKEVITVAGRTVQAFIDESTQETSELVPGGKRRIAAVSVIVSQEDFPAAPKLKSVCIVNENKLIIDEITGEPGLWQLDLVAPNAR